jgi:UDP-glucose 4-epimerase
VQALFTSNPIFGEREFIVIRDSRRRVLVTGGFGFIGSHLVELLLEDSETHVHVVDSLITSPIDVGLYCKRIAHPDLLTYTIGTVKEYLSSPRLPNYDEVYHLASVVGPVGVLGHAGDILLKIAEDTSLVASYAHSMGARVVDVSTSEVYGGGRDGYCSEKDVMIITPRYSARLEYAVAKLGAEISLINLSKSQSLNVTIVRPFNVAGPRQSGEGGFVLPRFIRQALGGEPLTVYGDGQSIRAFTHVRDIADGIVRAMRLGESGEIYNIGNPSNKTTILELAYKVRDVIGSSSEIAFIDPKTLWGPMFEEANDKYPDADRAIHHLKWQPSLTLDQIVRDTAEYIREERRD